MARDPQNFLSYETPSRSDSRPQRWAVASLVCFGATAILALLSALLIRAKNPPSPDATVLINAFICSAMCANLVGMVTGLRAVAEPRTSRKTLAILALVLNFLPPAVLGMFYMIS